jgi:hypothetical protein
MLRLTLAPMNSATTNFAPAASAFKLNLPFLSE